MTEPYCDFQVGDKVAVRRGLRASDYPGISVAPLPELKVFTVSAIKIVRGVPAIQLAEQTCGSHRWYVASAFRRVLPSTKPAVEALKKAILDVLQNDRVPV